MEDTDGEEVIKFSKEVNPDAPVIGWTAYDRRQKGADLNVRASVDVDILFEAIETLLGEKKRG